MRRNARQVKLEIDDGNYSPPNLSANLLFAQNHCFEGIQGNSAGCFSGTKAAMGGAIGIQAVTTSLLSSLRLR
jgi:hypothetical protein